MITAEEVLETLEMIEELHLDIRTVTLSVQLYDCGSESVEKTVSRTVEKLLRAAEHLVPVVDAVSGDLGIPIVNKRISVSPVSRLMAPTRADSFLPMALALDKVAKELGVDFLGGYSAPVHKGMWLPRRRGSIWMPCSWWPKPFTGWLIVTPSGRDWIAAGS